MNILIMSRTGGIHVPANNGKWIVEFGCFPAELFEEQTDMKILIAIDWARSKGEKAWDNLTEKEE